jgi:hypothetical protein
MGWAQLPAKFEIELSFNLNSAVFLSEIRVHDLVWLVLTLLDLVLDKNKGVQSIPGFPSRGEIYPVHSLRGRWFLFTVKLWGASVSVAFSCPLTISVNFSLKNTPTDSLNGF